MLEDKKFFSPAKINLFLEVFSKRKDNYHEINSLICFCNIGDFIKIKKSKKLELEVSGEFSSYLQNNKNIIIKTHQILKHHFKIQDFHIFLEKNLPVASGIGGGSSNAATYFRIVEKYFNLKIEDHLKIKILLEIGSDVPVCYYQNLSLVSGLGEKITFLPPILDTHILLVNPMIEVSTKFVFSCLEHFSKNKTIFKNYNLKKIEIFEKVIKTQNDLELIAIKKFSEISMVINTIREHSNPILVRMSGSGATCFALFNSEKELNEAYRNISKNKEKWWIKRGKILNNNRYIN